MKTEAVSAFVYQLSTMAYFFIFIIYLFFLTSSTLHTVFLYSHHPLQIHDHTDGFLQPVCLVSPG